MLKRHLMLMAIPLVLTACTERSPVGPTQTARDALQPSPDDRAQGLSETSRMHLAAATPETTVERFDTTGSFINPCTGEYLETAGTFTLVFRAMENGNVTTFGIQQTGRMLATGADTGTRYIINSNFEVSEKASFVNGTAHVSLVEHTRAIALGKAPNLHVLLLIHLTINAGGEVTAEFELLGEGCLGPSGS